MTPVPAEPPDEPDQGTAVRRFPEGLTLSVAVVLGAVIVLAALLIGRSLAPGSTEIGTAGTDSTTTTLSPSVTPRPTIGSDTQEPDTVEPEPDEGSAPDEQVEPEDDGDDVPLISCPGGVDPLICEAVEFVQRTRGRPFKTFPNVQILEDAEFDAGVLEDFDESIADLEAADVTLSALGLLDEDVSYVELFREALEVGAVGRYDLETEELVLRGDELSLHVRNVLIHELTHALDDQWFDLDRVFDDDEAAYGFLAVVEGNASRVDDLWTSGLDPADQALLARQELATLGPGDLRRLLAIPSVVLQLQLSPYEDGAAYVEELVASGGEAAVDGALEVPPTSSEEVLHPLTDRLLLPEVDVEPPPAEGEVVAEGRLGELVLRLWLGRSAGTGWGGDSFVAWTDGDRNCIAVDVAADSDGDLEEIRSAAAAWARERQADRSVTPVGADGDLVRISGCQ